VLGDYQYSNDMGGVYNLSSFIYLLSVFRGLYVAVLRSNDLGYRIVLEGNGRPFIPIERDLALGKNVTVKSTRLLHVSSLPILHRYSH
jgi:hypothetical protein